MKFVIQKPMKIREQWEPWFAWHPAGIEFADGSWGVVWLNKIERKETIGYGGVQWRYRELLMQPIDERK